MRQRVSVYHRANSCARSTTPDRKPANIATTMVPQESEIIKVAGSFNRDAWKGLGYTVRDIAIM